VTSLRLSMFRSFVDMDPIELGQINVFIGPNNAGKSSLLRAVYAMQEGAGNMSADVRMDADASTIEIGLTGVHGIRRWGNGGELGDAVLQIELTSGGALVLRLIDAGAGVTTVDHLPQMEPDHFIVPFFSRRKAVGYQEDVREQVALQVSPRFDFLAAKLSRLGNFAFPPGQRYRETCEAVLGFVVTAVPSTNGQRPAVYLPDRRTIPLDQMGEGSRTSPDY
jgi:hypothetical protein